MLYHGLGRGSLGDILGECVEEMSGGSKVVSGGMVGMIKHPRLGPWSTPLSL